MNNQVLIPSKHIVTVFVSKKNKKHTHGDKQAICCILLCVSKHKDKRVCVGGGGAVKHGVDILILCVVLQNVGQSSGSLYCDI